MKKCPFCAEEIQSEAIKCKHCGEFLDGNSHRRVVVDELPWYFKTHFVILAFLSVGPFALPLIWWHPKIKKDFKIIITTLVILAAFLLFSAVVRAIAALSQYMNVLNHL